MFGLKCNTRAFVLTAGALNQSCKKARSRDPGSGTFLAQIRKVEARLGKLEVRPKKEKRSSPIFGLEIRKITPN